jgi:acyl dehydratase
VPTVFAAPADLLDAVGQDLGTSAWVTVTQERVAQFSEATQTWQWIHDAGERADAGPFGGPISHGYLTLSMVNEMLPQLLEVPGASMGVNYGTGKVRFPAPVPVGARIRGRGQVSAAEPVGEGVQVVVQVTVEVEGGDKPACVVETISRFFP